MILFGNYGSSGWRLKGGVHATFRPVGRMYYVGRSPNIRGSTRGDVAIAVSGPSQLEARIIVGFNVDGKPRWRLRDVQNIVLREKHAEGLGAGASFLMQHGIYQETKKAHVDRERGCQIVLLNLYDKLTLRQFLVHIHRMARVLRTKLRQDAVLVQVTAGGRPVRGGSWQERASVRKRGD